MPLKSCITSLRKTGAEALAGAWVGRGWCGLGWVGFDGPDQIWNYPYAHPQTQQVNETKYERIPTEVPLL